MLQETNISNELNAGNHNYSLQVDGGAIHNHLLMQFQANILNISLNSSYIIEKTALGVCFIAGLQVGVWNSLNELKSLIKHGNTWYPMMDDTERFSKVSKINEMKLDLNN